MGKKMVCGSFPSPQESAPPLIGLPGDSIKPPFNFVCQHPSNLLCLPEKGMRDRKTLFAGSLYS